MRQVDGGTEEAGCYNELWQRNVSGGFKTLTMDILLEMDFDFEIPCLNQCGYVGKWDLSSCFGIDLQTAQNSKKPLSW